MADLVKELDFESGGDIRLISAGAVGDVRTVEDGINGRSAEVSVNNSQERAEVYVGQTSIGQEYSLQWNFEAPEGSGLESGTILSQFGLIKGQRVDGEMQWAVDGKLRSAPPGSYLVVDGDGNLSFRAYTVDPDQPKVTIDGRDYVNMVHQAFPAGKFEEGQTYAARVDFKGDPQDGFMTFYLNGEMVGDFQGPTLPPRELIEGTFAARVGIYVGDPGKGERTLLIDDVEFYEGVPPAPDGSTAPPSPEPVPTPEPEPNPEPAPETPPVDETPAPAPEPEPEPTTPAPTPEPAPTGGTAQIDVREGWNGGFVSDVVVTPAEGTSDWAVEFRLAGEGEIAPDEIWGGTLTDLGDGTYRVDGDGVGADGLGRFTFVARGDTDGVVQDSIALDGAAEPTPTPDPAPAPEVLGTNVISGFDIDGGGESTFDRFDLTIGAETLDLQTTEDFQDAVFTFQNDDVAATAAILDSTDLIFVQDRDDQGQVTEAVRFEDIIGKDLTVDDLVANGVNTTEDLIFA